MRRKTWVLVAAVVLVLGLVGAGCGGTSSSTGTSSTGTSSGDSVSTNNTASPHTKAVKFAECMRANGVSAFPDPDATGALTIDAVANRSSVDTDSAAFEQALSVCKDLQPPGFTGHERSTKEQEAALEFAQCIRRHGVKDFPDPGKHDPLVDTRRIPSTDRPGGLDILNAAMRTCGSYAAAAGVKGP